MGNVPVKSGKDRSGGRGYGRLDASVQDDEDEVLATPANPRGAAAQHVSPWRAVYTLDKKLYYWNFRTGETSWERPDGEDDPELHPTPHPRTAAEVTHEFLAKQYEDEATVTGQPMSRLEGPASDGMGTDLADPTRRDICREVRSAAAGAAPPDVHGNALHDVFGDENMGVVRQDLFSSPTPAARDAMDDIRGPGPKTITAGAVPSAPNL
eukprot:TRINITY_DN72659_c0_g1_i1.p1 TRINITY_DN72659_c0_g1~~TRINITY_DN72659_c0_g1_i1.p1  ORF type:complete len:225 (+),score=19.68 TRINITY_DN72659_c0_g1_i1:48-677(+)